VGAIVGLLLVVVALGTAPVLVSVISAAHGLSLEHFMTWPRHVGVLLPTLFVGNLAGAVMVARTVSRAKEDQ
jgi:hypothetical protein